MFIKGGLNLPRVSPRQTTCPEGPDFHFTFQSKYSAVKTPTTSFSVQWNMTQPEKGKKLYNLQ